MGINFRVKFTIRLLFKVFLLLIFPVFVLASDFSIIANKNVPEKSLTKEEIKAIYLGKKTKWSDNSPVRFYLIRSPKAQMSFLEAYVGKTPEQFENYWMQNVFTGKGVMPDMFENSSELQEAVEKNSGAIGFVLEVKPGGTTKIIGVE